MRALAIAVVLFALGGPAIACSCVPPDKGPPPPILLSARVIDVRIEQGGRDATYTLDVSSHLIGRTPRVIKVRAGTDGAACGVTFERGKSQLFALMRHERSYTTNLCLMLKARK